MLASKNLKEVLAYGLLDCHNSTQILNQKPMNTENTSVKPEAAAAKQAWSAPTLDCLSVSSGTAATSNNGMDGGTTPNVTNT